VCLFVISEQESEKGSSSQGSSSYTFTNNKTVSTTHTTKKNVDGVKVEPIKSESRSHMITVVPIRSESSKHASHAVRENPNLKRNNFSRSLGNNLISQISQ
jgi:hypothetical protein